jgi:SAM-dependent methyltransferase
MASHAKTPGGDALSQGRVFDGCYYATSCGRPYARNDHWLAFFGGIADRIVSDIRPRRVLDAGCALGLLVETLRARDVDAVGVDISAFAIDHVYEPIKPFCRQGSISEAFSDRYDLIVCIEVLEHMPSSDAELAVGNFCTHTEDVLLSTSPSDFREATHINVQPPEYWARLFARHSFYRDLDFDASFITPWAVRFRHRSDPVHDVVAAYERGFSRLAIERSELRSQAVQTQAEISRLTQALEEASATRRALEQQAMDHDARVTELNASLTGLNARIAQQRETIDEMKRSWFWRARKPWAWLSRSLGRPT